MTQVGDPGSTTRVLSVFLSYARADRARIAPLAAALEGQGIKVWWDALIEGGAAFSRTIEAALDAADVIVVAWSQSSVASDWVRDEAAHGRDRGRFVPISLDGTPPPLGFRQYHFIDFTRWNGNGDAPELRQLLSAIRSDALALPEPASAVRSWTARGGVPRRALLVGAGVAGLAAFGGGLWWRQAMVGATSGTSIAVLPFANLSGDPGQGYFSDGLSEELRSRLGQTGQFRVAAQVSSNQFRDHTVDAITAAAKLGVAYLLDGSVRRQGRTLRIAAELIDAKSGLSKWSQTYDSQLTDIFSVQSDIGAMVVQAIDGQITPSARAALGTAGTTNVDAYDAYLKGRAQYQLDIDAASDHAAVAYFDAAIAADPHYAQAYAARAGALLDIGSNYSAAAELRHVFDAALAAAARAVALAPDLAAAQLAQGDALFTGRLDARGARRYYDRAYQLGRHEADILEVFAFFASKTSRSAEALQAIDEALVLDPLNPLMFRAKGRFLLAARRYDEAATLLRQALDMNPKLSGARAHLGCALLMQGRYAEARAAYLSEPRQDLSLTGLAILDYKLGRRGDARTEQQLLIHKFGDSVLYQQAQIQAQWGNSDAAITALHNARTMFDSGLTNMGIDPILDPLRHDSRFISLLDSLGLA